MKRILSLLLALVMVLTLFPVMAPRAEAKTGGKLVALTFDDGPSSKYTPQLLDGLKDRGVPVLLHPGTECGEQPLHCPPGL